MKHIRQYGLAILIMTCLQIKSQYSSYYSDSLFNIGVHYYNDLKYQDAIDIFEKCKQYDLAYLDSTSNRLNYCDMWIGCCFYLINNEKEAQRYNPKYYKYPPIDRTMTTESDSLADLYESYILIGDKMKVIDILHRIIDSETCSIGSTNYWIANTIELCGREYEDIDSMELAASYYKRAYDIRKKVLDSNHCDVASSMIDIAYCRRELTIDTLSAIDYYKRGFEILSQYKILDSYVNADRMHDLARLCSEKKDFESAISYELQSIAIFKKKFGGHNDYINSQIARGYNALMINCLASKKYGDAERYGKRALEIRKELLGESHPYYINTLSTLATVYADAGKYNEAIQLYSMCLNNFKMIEKEHEDFQEQVYFQLLKNYAHILSLNGDFETAIMQLSKLIKVAESSKWNWDKIIIESKSHLADYYANINEYKKAIALEKECLDYSINKNDYSLFCSAGDLIIGYSADLGDFETVNQYCISLGYIDSMKIAENDNRELIYSYRYLADYFSEKKHHKESISLLQKALELSIKCDSVIDQLNCYRDVLKIN